MAIEIHARYMDYNRELQLFIFERDPDGGISAVCEPLRMTFRKIEPHERFDPALCLDYKYSQSFMKAMGDLAEREGFKTKKDATLEGSLEATRFHLEDLRVLLKLRNK